MTWERIFNALIGHALEHPNATLLFMVDEIQWIAKRNSGFASKVKRARVDWEKAANIKVIVCGSSNRFFEQTTGGQSSVLRGLRAHADMWVRPFSLAEVQRPFFPDWNQEETCLIYMMVGGVPYYLKQVAYQKKFITAINATFFTRSTTSPNKLDEVINLEFNKTSTARAKQILGALGQAGKTARALSRATGVAESSTRETIEKLVEYGLAFEKRPLDQSIKKNRSGTRDYMRDFYLKFTFRYC